MKVYYDKDCDLSIIQGKKVAIIGYGSQGHAQACNLKDSGVDVTVGLRKGSATVAKAEAHGLKVTDVASAVAAADLVVVDREAVGEGQGGALLDVRLDFVLVQRGLELVRGQDHDQVGSSNGGSNVSHFQAMGFSLGNSGRAFTQANGHVNAEIGRAHV